MSTVVGWVVGVGIVTLGAVIVVLAMVLADYLKNRESA
jgi:hypothetical protein